MDMPTESTGSFNASTVAPPVLSTLNDMIGREILITTDDNKRFTGVLTAISQDLAFGMHYVSEITKETENNYLKTQKDSDKKVFPFSDIAHYVYITEEKKGHKLTSKFVTDRQYHGELPKDDEELELWDGGEDEDIGGSIEDQDHSVAQHASQHSRRVNQNNGSGWSVDDMFAVNQKMNVVSTFKDDLTQYTTVEVVGTEEDRARAERLAREIESNQSSKFYANLENDDVERDLDRTTHEEEFDNGGNHRRGNNKGNNSYNQPPQQRRNPNVAPNGQPVNRRAEGLRSDRRNSGSSSANNSRYGPPAPAQNYQQQQQQQVPKGGNYNNRRQNEEYRENDWQMAKGKGQNQGHDQSFRHQQKQMLDPRPSPKQPTNEVEKGPGSSSRVADLKSWGNDFAIATSPKEQSPAPGSTPPVAQGTSGSAWNRGPPSSLVSKGSSTESTPPPAEAETLASQTYQTPAAASSSKPANQKKEETPSTSAEEQEDEDGKGADGDNMSTTDASETSSVVTSKSSSFKFNINAPEFKPRVAPATPTPTTPNGPAPNMNPIPPQQFVPQEFQQQQHHPAMIPQGGPPGAPMGIQGAMAPHMGPGGVPPNQTPQLMMWTQQPGQQGYPGAQQFPIQQIPMAGVPGQMYGAAATAPSTVSNQQQPTQQIPTSVTQTDGRQGNPQHQREGEYREAQPCFYPYSQGGPAVVPIAQPFFHPQYQAGMQQTQYMKMMPQQGPQVPYQQRFQAQQVYMVQQGGQGPQQRYQGPPQQQPPHQHGGEQQQQQQGGPQSHPNSQPTTPGPRGDQQSMSGPKATQQGQNGMHREPEGGSNASLSGSSSSQSGKRSGSPQNNIPQQQQQPPQQQQQAQQQQGLPHGGPPQMIVPQGHMAPYMVVQHPQMHTPIPASYYAQQYYPMMVPPQMQMQQNQHGQQSVMGERADQGFPQATYFDYRNMPPIYQQQHQPHQQVHGGHMSRQNSLQQQFGGNGQGVNLPSQQGPPPQQQQQQQQQQGGLARDQQPQSAQ
ncbi:unnamed protein product [Caenorhabditis sp. 36 PRJEB53466]|nr:unnamed protein product [Caenorhabditis sp. 36 PRJEB53466]